MFDAKKLLGQIVGGGTQQHAGLGGLGDLLGQLAGGQQGSSPQPGQSAGGGDNGLGGLSDMLRQFTGDQGAQGGGGQGASGSGASGSGAGGLGGLGDLLGQLGGGQGGSAASGSTGSGQGSGGLGGLGDLLGKLQQQGGGSAGGSTGGGGGGSSSASGGGIMDMLGQVLAQATDGAKDGAGRISDATGAGDALENMTGGRSADDLMGQLKDLIANNKGAAGALAGGLGALVLGTQTGRGLAVDAAKLGGLVLIGGLAYKAYQNHQAGKPLMDTARSSTDAAPEGTGFEPDAVTNDAAVLYIRGMIAAAAADGRIDQSEQAKIFGSLEQAGMEDSAREFIQGELDNPASIEDLVAAVSSEGEAIQLFTAARMAIDFDSASEQQFLGALADELNIAPELVQHIDAAARGDTA